MREQRLIIQQVDPRRPVPGGIDTCIRGLVRYCPPGIELSLVGVDAIGDARLFRWAPVDVDGVTLPFLPVARLDPSKQDRRIPHSVRLAAGLLRLRRRLREFDAVQTHRLEIGAAVQKLLPRRRHIQFLHIDGRDSLADGSDSMWRHLPRVYTRLERLVLPRSADVVVFSTGGAERLRRLGDHIRFSPTWYDPQIFSPTPVRRTGWGRVLWVGRVEPPKDPLLAVEVLRRLPAEYTLTVVGDGVLRGELEGAARSAGLTNRITVTGAVPKPEVAAQLARHDVLLMTSHYEGFPRAVVEALASGIPVVTTRGGEPNGLIRDGATGFHTETRTPEELAECLVRARALDRGACAASVAHLSAPVIVANVLRARSGARGDEAVSTR